MNMLTKIEYPPDQIERCRGGQFPLADVAWWCPGCRATHQVVTPHSPYVPPGFVPWSFNGDYEKPTLAPSILVTGPMAGQRCHCFITGGMIQFLGDCSHDFRGKSVPLQRKPVEG